MKLGRVERARKTRAVLDEMGPDLARRYEAGESLPKLAGEFDLYVGTLSNEIKRRGGNIRSHNLGSGASRAAVREFGSEMARRYAAGELLREIASDYGVGLGAVSGAIRANGGKIRPRGTASRPSFGPKHPSWRGGTHMKDGYRVVLIAPDDPMIEMASARRYVLEHRLVMARMVKRPLLPSETVHHINGDKLDNRPENLQLRVGRHGKGVHLQCHDCGSQNVGPVRL